MTTDTARPELHPLERLARGEARTLREALDLMERGAVRELRQAGDDPDWRATLQTHLRLLAEIKRAYVHEHLVADQRVAERLRGLGQSDFAAAVESRRFDALAY